MSSTVNQMLCMPWPFLLGLLKADSSDKYYEKADLVFDIDKQTITSNKKHNALWASPLSSSLNAFLNVLMRGNVINYAAGSMPPPVGNDINSIQCGPILLGVVNYCQSFVMKLLMPVPLFQTLLNRRVFFDLGLYREYINAKWQQRAEGSECKSKGLMSMFFLEKFTTSQAFCEFVASLDAMDKLYNNSSKKHHLYSSYHYYQHYRHNYKHILHST